VGCNSPVGTTREGENNKIEILRLLLAITSKAMYMPASVLPVKGVRVLTYLVTNPDKRSVLSVLCSLLNTTLKYNPASWRVPYDHVVFTDPRQVLVTYSIQFLLVLLLYPVPEASAGPIMKNNYRHYLGRLHRTQDFQFCVDGMTRILNQPVRRTYGESFSRANMWQIQATTSYLPGSQKSLKWAPEMMMLFWEALQCNKRFRSFIIDTDRVHDFVILIMYYALEYRLDQSKSGVVRMCVFVLQTLSTEPKFGKSLNKRFEGQNSLPASVRIASFSGTYADYLIIVRFRSLKLNILQLTEIVHLHPYHNQQRQAFRSVPGTPRYRCQHRPTHPQPLLRRQYKAHPTLCLHVGTHLLARKRNQPLPSTLFVGIDECHHRAPILR
jgi:hypothetical protein